MAKTKLRVNNSSSSSSGKVATSFRWVYMIVGGLIVLYGFARTTSKAREGKKSISTTVAGVPRFTYPSITFCDTYKGSYWNRTKKINDILQLSPSEACKLTGTLYRLSRFIGLA